jgi:hypothetical protein
MMGSFPLSPLLRMVTIMKSMTAKELDCKVPIDHSRLMRIARGSGAHPQEVSELLQQHKQVSSGGNGKGMGRDWCTALHPALQFEKMFAGMNKAGLLEGDDKTLAKKMQRNPQQMQSILGQVMDPAMIQQMGGAAGMMDMIKQVRCPRGVHHAGSCVLKGPV